MTGEWRECDCTKRDCERDGCSSSYLYDFAYASVGGDDITIEYADTSFTTFFGGGTYPYEINSAGTEMKVRVPTEARTGRVSIWYYYWEDEETPFVRDRVYSSEIFTVIEHTGGGGTTTTFNVPSTVSGGAQAYPNPVSHRLRFANLSPNRLYTYKIYTTAGWQVLSGHLQSDEAVDISTLSAGQYILVLQDDSSSEILRSSLLIK